MHTQAFIQCFVWSWCHFWQRSFCVLVYKTSFVQYVLRVVTRNMNTFTESSSSMESDIILEGFRMAKKQHGLCYTNFIGDGDSSVQSTLRDNVHEWGHDLTKQECANHPVKYFRSSLENLVKTNPHYKGRHKLMKGMRK